MRFSKSLCLLVFVALAVDGVQAFSPVKTTTTTTTTNLSTKQQQQQSSRLYLSTESKTALVTKSIESSSSTTSDDDDDNVVVIVQEEQKKKQNAYVQFAQTYPFVNNLMIATGKTAAADLLAQTVIAQTPIMEIDVQRSFLFCLFGAIYLGAFQYAYQVQVFKKLFNVDQFTNQSWSEKLQDKEGLKALAAQTVLDLTVLTVIYLPTFYMFKASVFSGSSSDPATWIATGLDNYQTNFAKDEFDLLRVWLPADLICFSVPLYLRLPVRHVVSFVWTAYLSFARGGH